jgi:hypothetical protein
MNLRDLKDMDKDDFLGLIGLQSKHSFTRELLGTLGTFGIGLLVGAGVALLLAPKPGRDLRGEIRAKVARGKGVVAKPHDGEGDSSAHGA